MFVSAELQSSHSVICLGQKDNVIPPSIHCLIKVNHTIKIIDLTKFWLFLPILHTTVIVCSNTTTRKSAKAAATKLCSVLLNWHNLNISTGLPIFGLCVWQMGLMKFISQQLQN